MLYYANGFETTLTPFNPAIQRGLAQPIFGSAKIVYTKKSMTAPWKRPAFEGLGDTSFFTTLDNSVRSLFGMKPIPTDIPTYLMQALNNTNQAIQNIQGLDTQIKTLQTQVQAFESNQSTDVQSRAQAVDAEATGDLNAFDTLQTSLTSLQQDIQAAQAAYAAQPTSSTQTATGTTVASTGALSEADAQTLFSQSQTLLSQSTALQGQVKALASDVNSVVEYAQGKGFSALVSSVEGTVGSVTSGVGSTLSTSAYIIAGAIGLGILIFMSSSRARGAATGGVL